MSFTTCLIVMAGGALGTLARYVVSALALPLSGQMPWGTLVVNVTGSFLIGFFGTLTLAHGRFPVSENWRLFVMIGICGGYTTFSSFSLQTLDLLRQGALSRAPSARTIARLMTIGRDDLSKSETVTVAAIEGGVPLLVEAREVIAAFQAMIRKKSLADLDTWLERARSGLVASFANGVVRDRAAVSAAISSPWSNGQTEGQITKLKLVKRQMYGRGKIDLLQARVIGAG